MLQLTIITFLETRPFLFFPFHLNTFKLPPTGQDHNESCAVTRQQIESFVFFRGSFVKIHSYWKIIAGTVLGMDCLLYANIVTAEIANERKSLH